MISLMKLLGFSPVRDASLARVGQEMAIGSHLPLLGADVRDPQLPNQALPKATSAFSWSWV